MSQSLEMRWFQRGALPAAAKTFVSGWAIPAATEKRTDVYLAGAGPELGIKLRAGKSLEIKRLLVTHASMSKKGVEGKVETWVKWIFPLDPSKPAGMLSGDAWKTVVKERFLRKFEVDDVGAATTVDPATMPKRGVNFEITTLTIDGAEWWSAAFEAFGPDAELGRTLDVVVGIVAAEPGCPELKAVDAAGYPAWLEAGTGGGKGIVARKTFHTRYLVGKTAPSGGTKIQYIYGHSDAVVVFKGEDGTIYWELAADDTTPLNVLAHQQYDRLSGRSRACLPKAKLDRFHDDLALALFLALGATDEASVMKAFETAAGELGQESQKEAQLRYVEYGGWSAAIIIAAGLGVAMLPQLTVATLGFAAVGGALGALTSVIQRASKLELGQWETPDHLKTQGTLRILLGTIFGVLAIAAIKSKLLLTAATDNFWGMFLITFVAGVSERLIPELITKIENSNSTVTTAKSVTTAKTAVTTNIP